MCLRMEEGKKKTEEEGSAYTNGCTRTFESQK